MSEGELLKLAAKAAGIVGEWTDNGCDDRGMTIGIRLMDDPNYIWNPLEDDGDALRLAASLRLEIAPECYRDGFVQVFASDENRIDEQIAGDIYAATRRAIVRAAAEIGKQK